MAQGWTIHIDVSGNTPGGNDFEDAILTFVDLLTDHGGSVASSTDHTRYGATFTYNFPAELPASVELEEPFVTTADAAAHGGVKYFRDVAAKAGLPNWPIVRLEVLTWDELDADLERPLIPDLVGVSEIAELLGVTRQRASALSKTTRFPDPIAKLAGGPVWTRPSLNLFLESWTRAPGRPKLPLDRDEFPDVKELMERKLALTQLLHDTTDVENARSISAELRKVTEQLDSIMDIKSGTTPLM